jgi:acetolactate synthase-1/2/3 large subunit
VRWNIASVTVVNNNGGGSQSKQGFDRAYNGQATPTSRRLWTYTDVDLARVACDLGALGIRVSRPAELAPSLERALAAGRPAVIDVRTDIDVMAPAPVA